MTATFPDQVEELSASQRDAARWATAVHDRLTSDFTALDGGPGFREDSWSREGGGGGVSRVMLNGRTFEKAGVNRSVVWGPLPEEAAKRLGGNTPTGVALTFFAAGVSVVMHPSSPKVPTVHFNVRYFEIGDAATGTTLDAWFGGGTDITPYFPHEEDPRDFHRALRRHCDSFDARLYPEFKGWCDRYFVNTHRGGEARGMGGVFFDHVRPGDNVWGLDRDTLFSFGLGLTETLCSVYGTIVNRRRHETFGEREKHFQLLRRGRYVEFNLVHDRGTLFGLQTGARIESVLMSLPAVAAWDYAPTFEPGSFEARFMDMLAPRDWV